MLKNIIIFSSGFLLARWWALKQVSKQEKFYQEQMQLEHNFKMWLKSNFPKLSDEKLQQYWKEVSEKNTDSFCPCI